MNKQFPFGLHLAVVAGTLLSLNQMTAAPASAKPGISGSPLIQSNAIPQSMFVIPTSPKEGRDPFFPTSERFASSGTSTNARPAPATSLSALILQGISGSGDRRLAIVNGRTLAEGEETEISVGATRIRFRCVEIKADAVVIEMGDNRRELRLRSGF
jgi:hypothetical protein